ENTELDHEKSLADVDLEAYFGDWDDAPRPRANDERELPPLENNLTREPDLYDHLLWQLHMSDAPAKLREIAELIIGNLTPDGFLAASEDELRSLAGADHPDCSSEDVEAALELVRSFDPPGIACSDLRHSLLCQLRARGDADGLAWQVVEQHWDAFLKR